MNNAIETFPFPVFLCMPKPSIQMFLQDCYVVPDRCLILIYIIVFHLHLSGTSDGQTKVIREGDNGVAYAWNLREQKWDKVIHGFILITIPTSCHMVTSSIQH